MKSTCVKNQATKEPEPARKFLKGSPNETKVPGSDEVSGGGRKRREEKKKGKQISFNTVVAISFRSHVTEINCHSLACSDFKEGSKRLNCPHGAAFPPVGSEHILFQALPINEDV